MEEMTLDKFGEMMDDFLTKNHIQMMIDMPEGAQDVLLEDNAGLGPVPQFYILLRALPVVYRGFRSILAPDKQTTFIDDVLKMVRDEILEDIQKTENGKQEEAKDERAEKMD